MSNLPKELQDQIKEEAESFGRLLEEEYAYIAGATKLAEIAVGFPEWIDANDYFRTNNEGKWKQFAGDKIYFTTSELLTMYINQTKNK